MVFRECRRSKAVVLGRKLTRGTCRESLNPIFYNALEVLKSLGAEIVDANITDIDSLLWFECVFRSLNTELEGG